MNFPHLESDIHRQRCRQWIPLVTQQLRLRHLHQVTILNITLKEKSQLYFTLHLTSLSAPFYTSEKVLSVDPKWLEIDASTLPNTSASAVVLRIWQYNGAKNLNKIISTWGINFSGLVYLGNKFSDLQAVNFESNSVILHMHDGFFTSYNKIKTASEALLPYINNDGKFIRLGTFKAPKNEIIPSYGIDKLKRLHSLQISLKNKSLNVQMLREKLQAKIAATDLNNEENRERKISGPSSVKYAPQLLTMTCLNKMLHEKPTKFQRQEMTKLRKEIETSKLRNRLLSHERNKKLATIRHLQTKYNTLAEENDENSILITENYHQLEKEIGKLKEYKREILKHRELLIHISNQLFHRKRQLLHQLLFIYPVQQTSEGKYLIHGIYLPSSDILADCSDQGLSVALGYVAHVLQMCSRILQVSLRYPINYFGSRSLIRDNMSSKILDKDREFPLFTKGKEKMQFTYAVYLLNKNIAQLRWLFFMHTSDLKATLPNLLGLLSNNKECKHENLPIMTNTIARYYQEVGSSLNVSEAEQNEGSSLSSKFNIPKRPSRLKKVSPSGLGLNEILTLPEEKLKRASSSINAECSNVIINTVKEYNNCCDIKRDDSKFKLKHSNSIEQGTDLLDPNLDLSETKEVSVEDVHVEVFSLDSTEDKCDDVENSSLESTQILEVAPESNVNLGNVVSQPKEETELKVRSESLKAGLGNGANKDGTQMRDSQHEFLKNWFKDGPSLSSSSEDHLSCEAFLNGSIPPCLMESDAGPLTARTDALLSRKSFNLVRHDYS